MSEGTLEIDHLHKRYGETRALAGLTLTAHAGEILGIAGPNGAGKSTLIRVLAGEERADSGRLRLDGEPWEPTSGRGAAVVHQEPQLFPNLTVAENLLVGREAGRWRRPRIDGRQRALLGELGLGAHADADVERLRLADQQSAEIARALDMRARVFLFDEPNSALTAAESAALFGRMRALAEAGHIVLLVSHRLSELAAHCARVGIVRDGRVHTVLAKERLSEEAIAHELVAGASLGERQRDRSHSARGAAPSLAAVRGWTHAGARFADVQLTVSEGQVVALLGVEGSGARELLRSLALVEAASGEYRMGDAPTAAASPRQIAYVPATRQQSLYGHMNVEENLTIRMTNEISGRGGSLRRSALRTAAAEARTRFGIKARSLRDPIRALSGGNQQKVAIAQALAKAPRLLVIEEPTRGVDVRSRRDIYRLLRGFARAGNGVIMFCTEVLEVFEAADHAVVLSGGALSPPLEISRFSRVEDLARTVAQLEQGRA